jgi:hypothetical protein
VRLPSLLLSGSRILFRSDPPQAPPSPPSPPKTKNVLSASSHLSTQFTSLPPYYSPPTHRDTGSCQEEACDKGAAKAQNQQVDEDGAVSDEPEDGDDSKVVSDYELPEELIRQLESDMEPVYFSDIYRTKAIPTVEADKLIASGFPVLDDFPDSDAERLQFRKAICEHGKCYIRNSNISYYSCQQQ